MKKYLIALLFIGCTNSYSQTKEATIAIIPEHVTLVKKSGTFTLPKNTLIEAAPELRQSIEFLKRYLGKATGSTLSFSPANNNATVSLELNKNRDTEIGDEGYRLHVTTERVSITANTPAGIFYGCQTLVQLLPKEIESASPVTGVAWQIPAVEITDYPRFGWRGLMFDVARHFFTKDDVKDFIDKMVRYKFNLLHLHLTDDEGWRIQIKGLPKLTEVGAWNVKKEGYFGTFSKPEAGEKRNYGGFYTQDDIKELVQYAKDRFVNILPEIDVPKFDYLLLATS